MNKKNLIKSAVVFSCLVIASMLGFKVAQGYGGSTTPTPCASVTYAEWQSCSMGIQFRNVIGQSPANCALTTSQQLARARECSSLQNCSAVTYGAWKKCTFGVQWRDIIARAETNCKTTPAQELARVKSCNGSVLGEKVFANGTLLRGSDKKVYVVIDGRLKHLATVKELAKYAGKEILTVDDTIIASFNKSAVLGEKKYGNGELIRNNNVKVYVIVDGKKKHILNIPELIKNHFGKPIYHVTPEELETYPNY